MEKKLKGKVSVITGAAGLIGRTLIRRFAQEGACVIAADRTITEELVRLTEEIRAAGGKIQARKMDITDSGEISDVFASVEQEHGPIDLLINNAGVLRNAFEPFYQSKEPY